MNPLEFLYYTGYRLKKSRDLKNRKRLPAKVISVGNITAGGTGKTPAVIALAEKAKELGLHLCILTRGYRGTAKGPCFVSEGEGPLLGVREAGDEPFLMAERLKGVPIVKGADRYDAGIFALSRLDADSLTFILDDGFQHRRLYRDLDILLVDGTNPFGNRRLLPLGILREPLSEMRRADVIVITKIPRKGITGEERTGPSPFDNLIDEIRDHNPVAPLFIASHRPAGLVTETGVLLPLDTISGKSVFGFCGVGNPLSFRESLTGLAGEVRDVLAFRDHHLYGERDLAGIIERAERCGADWIVTTEKDIMKLKGFVLPENLVSLRIDFGIDDSFYEKVFRVSGPQGG